MKEQRQMAIATRTLTQMQNRPTSYEVAINGVPVAYTQRKTKHNLLKIAGEFSDMMLDLMDDWDGEAVYTNGQWAFGPAIIAFTGRTERDVASEKGLI